MSARDNTDLEADVQAAIEQVLSAERGTEAALEQARAQARKTVAAAADRAARIAARTRDRIAALHERCARELQTAIGAIESSAAATGRDVTCGEEGVQRLVRRVAGRLIRDDDDAAGR
jgi:vacuolar-type H+-ATPase subunit H